ncbi:class I SAM-dependent methyltransferase [Candidatus Parcubacteria bacterium]|nr:class I SAM-dependent methyltransferase [Candidatus Parcubacteria bacterium]
MSFTDPVKNLKNLNLHDGLIVADMGAGSGAYTLAAATHVEPGGRVYALDVQQDLLARIKNNAQAHKITNIEVVHGDIESVGGTRLKEKSIDVAIVSNVLFQLEDKDGFIQELQRILKSGGRVMVIDWTESFGGLGPHQDHIVTEESAKNLFEKAGFTLLNSFDPGDHHYALIYKMP